MFRRYFTSSVRDRLMGKPANTNQTRSTTDAKRVATQVVLSIHIPGRAISHALKDKKQAEPERDVKTVIVHY